MNRRIWLNNIIYWDLLVFRFIFDRNGRTLLDRSFFLISKSADGYLYAIAAVMLLFITPQSGQLFLKAGLLSYGMKVPLYMLIKRRVRRKRPFDDLEGVNFLLAPPDEFSFPSGHTAGAFVFAIICGHLFPLSYAPLLLWASLVGFSRIYVGVHYPTDILAGALLGVLCAKIGLLVI